jgi:hypothetical protein
VTENLKIFHQYLENPGTPAAGEISVSPGSYETNGHQTGVLCCGHKVHGPDCFCNGTVAFQEITLPYWNTKIHFRAQNSLPLVSILSQNNPNCKLFYFNTTLSSVLRSPKQSLPSILPIKILRAFLISPPSGLYALPISLSLILSF